MRIALYRCILIITEENLINKENVRTLDLLDVGMAISEARWDRTKWYEKELATTLKELEYVHHLVEYYQSTTHTVVYLRSEFEEAYNKFTHKWHLFSVKIVELQEDTLMALMTCKDTE